MRAIDADALIADCQLAQKQADRHGREFANAFYSGGGEVSTEWWCVEDMIENAPTIEPERLKSKWVDSWRSKMDGTRYWYRECKHCGYERNDCDPEKDSNFCPNCGADMRTPVEIARNIVHKVIDNSVWSDTVDTAKMHKVVDDKYAEMTKKTEESKRCDTCKHEKSHWFSRCADCSDYELWEEKDETGRSTTEN